MRLLVVEDASTLRRHLVDGLEAAGYAVDAVSNGRDGFTYARTTDYDAIVLDLMLPELSGLEVLARLRDAGQSTPVLVLSARDLVEHRVDALRRGADDYMIKPFDFGELLARLEALCRRARGASRNLIRVGDVSLDLGAKRFETTEGRLELSPREYALLEFLVLNAGRVVSRAELEEHLYDAERQVWSNTIDSAVAAVRRKLQAQGITDLIQTRRGQGYEIDPELAPCDH